MYFRRLRVDLPPLTAMPSRLNKKRSIGDEESPTTDEDEEPIIVTKRKAKPSQKQVSIGEPECTIIVAGL